MLTRCRKNACSPVEHAPLRSRFTKTCLLRGSEDFGGNVFVMEALAIDTNNR
jgi:hypothetical protein